MAAPRSAPATPPAASGTDVLLRTDGALGRLTLNRPASINALTLEMVRQLHVGLDALEADETISVVVLDGEGERGFCAGGDIVALYEAARSGDVDAAWQFWAEEYVLNARIARFPKPVVAIMDGIVMGGGIGLAGHASHRLVTERVVSAMPEVGIGFAPDVGGTWLFTRMPGELGTHLALTGGRMGAYDAIAAGLADRVVAAAAVPQLVAGLASGDLPAAFAQAESTAVEVTDGQLAAARSWIAEAYAHDSAEAIVAALQARPESAATKAAEQILRASPTSVKVTLRALRQATELASLEDALQQELRVSCGLLTADFAEGVRAQVIDKDRQPRWHPPTLAEVDDAGLGRFFAPLGDRDLHLDPREGTPAP